MYSATNNISPDSQWVHLALSVDGEGDTITFYENGAPIRTYDAAGVQAAHASAGVVSIGSSDITGEVMKGRLAHARVYREAVRSEFVEQDCAAVRDPPRVPAGVWTHVQTNYDALSGSTELYINGESEGLFGKGVASEIPSNTNPLTIGGGGFEGDLGDLNLYSCKLNDRQIDRFVSDRLMYHSSTSLYASDFAPSSMGGVVVRGRVRGSFGRSFEQEAQKPSFAVGAINSLKRFSAQAWIKYTTDSKLLSTSDAMLDWAIEGGKLKFNGVASAVGVPAGVWTWVAVRADADASTLELFVGEEYEQVALGSWAPVTPAAGLVVSIGESGDVAFDDLEVFTGIVPISRFTKKRDLKQARIKLDRVKVLSRYGFDEAGELSTTAVDSGALQNNGTLSGAPTRVQPSYSAANVGIALTDASQYVQIAPAPYGELHLGLATMSAWVRYDGSDADGFKSVLSQEGVFGMSVGPQHALRFEDHVGGSLQSAETTALPSLYTNTDLTNTYGNTAPQTSTSWRLTFLSNQGGNTEVHMTECVLTDQYGRYPSNISEHTSSLSGEEFAGRLFDRVHGPDLARYNLNGTVVYEFDQAIAVSRIQLAYHDNYAKVPKGVRVEYKNDDGAWVNYVQFDIPYGLVAAPSSNTPFVYDFRFYRDAPMWTHYAVVLDAYNDRMRLYVNGDLQKEVARTDLLGLKIDTAAADLRIGGGLVGAVDDVELYEGAMEANEIDMLSSRASTRDPYHHELTTAVMSAATDDGYTAPSIEADQWTHIAAVFEKRSNRVCMFHNGAMIGCYKNYLVDFANVGRNSEDVLIGKRASEGENFVGIMDDVRVYDKSMSMNDISSLHGLYNPIERVFSGPSNGPWVVVADANGGYQIEALHLSEPTTLNSSNTLIDYRLVVASEDLTMSAIELYRFVRDAENAASFSVANTLTVTGTASKVWSAVTLPTQALTASRSLVKVAELARIQVYAVAMYGEERAYSEVVYANSGRVLPIVQIEKLAYDGLANATVGELTVSSVTDVTSYYLAAFQEGGLANFADDAALQQFVHDNRDTTAVDYSVANTLPRLTRNVVEGLSIRSAFTATPSRTMLSDTLQLKGASSPEHATLSEDSASVTLADASATHYATVANVDLTQLVLAPQVEVAPAAYSGPPRPAILRVYMQNHAGATNHNLLTGVFLYNDASLNLTDEVAKAAYDPANRVQYSVRSHTSSLHSSYNRIDIIKWDRSWADGGLGGAHLSWADSNATSTASTSILPVLELDTTDDVRRVVMPHYRSGYVPRAYRIELWRGEYDELIYAHDYRQDDKYNMVNDGGTLRNSISVGAYVDFAVDPIGPYNMTPIKVRPIAEVSATLTKGLQGPYYNNIDSHKQGRIFTNNEWGWVGTGPSWIVISFPTPVTLTGFKLTGTYSPVSLGFKMYADDPRGANHDASFTLPTSYDFTGTAPRASGMMDIGLEQTLPTALVGQYLYINVSGGANGAGGIYAKDTAFYGRPNTSGASAATVDTGAEVLQASAFVMGSTGTKTDDADGLGFVVNNTSGGFIYAQATLTETAELGQSFEWTQEIVDTANGHQYNPIAFLASDTVVSDVYRSFLSGSGDYVMKHVSGSDANHFEGLTGSARVTNALPYITVGDNVEAVDANGQGSAVVVRDTASGDLLNWTTASNPLRELTFKATLVAHPTDSALLDIAYSVRRTDTDELIFETPSLRYIYYGGWSSYTYNYIVAGQPWKARMYGYGVSTDNTEGVHYKNLKVLDPPVAEVTVATDGTTALSVRTAAALDFELDFTSEMGLGGFSVGGTSEEPQALVTTSGGDALALGFQKAGGDSGHLVRWNGGQLSYDGAWAPYLRVRGIPSRGDASVQAYRSAARTGAPVWSVASLKARSNSTAPKSASSWDLRVWNKAGSELVVQGLATEKLKLGGVVPFDVEDEKLEVVALAVNAEGVGKSDAYSLSKRTTSTALRAFGMSGTLYSYNHKTGGWNNTAYQFGEEIQHTNAFLLRVFQDYESEIVAGAFARQFTVLVTRSGSMYYAGTNFHGTEGSGTASNGTTDTHLIRDVTSHMPFDVKQIKQMASSGTDVFALLFNGEVWAVGRNGGGLLGQGDTTERHEYVKMPIDGEVAEIDAASSTFLARLATGEVFATGLYAVDGTSTARNTPTRVVLTGDQQLVRVMACGDTVSSFVDFDGYTHMHGQMNGGGLGNGRADGAQGRHRHDSYFRDEEEVVQMTGGHRTFFMTSKSGHAWKVGQHGEIPLMSGEPTNYVPNKVPNVEGQTGYLQNVKFCIGHVQGVIIVTNDGDVYYIGKPDSYGSPLGYTSGTATKPSPLPVDDTANPWNHSTSPGPFLKDPTLLDTSKWGLPTYSGILVSARSGAGGLEGSDLRVKKAQAHLVEMDGLFVSAELVGPTDLVTHYSVVATTAELVDQDAMLAWTARADLAPYVVRGEFRGLEKMSSVTVPFVLLPDESAMPSYLATRARVLVVVRQGTRKAVSVINVPPPRARSVVACGGSVERGASGLELSLNVFAAQGDCKTVRAAFLPHGLVESAADEELLTFVLANASPLVESDGVTPLTVPLDTHRLVTGVTVSTAFTDLSDPDAAVSLANLTDNDTYALVLVTTASAGQETLHRVQTVPVGDTVYSEPLPSAVNLVSAAVSAPKGDFGHFGISFSTSVITSASKYRFKSYEKDTKIFDKDDNLLFELSEPNTLSAEFTPTLGAVYKANKLVAVGASNHGTGNRTFYGYEMPLYHHFNGTCFPHQSFDIPKMDFIALENDTQLTLYHNNSTSGGAYSQVFTRTMQAYEQYKWSAPTDMYSNTRIAISNKPVAVLNWTSQWGDTNICNPAPQAPMAKKIYCVIDQRGMNARLVNTADLNDNTVYTVHALCDDGTALTIDQSSTTAMYNITNADSDAHAWVITVEEGAPETVLVGLCNYGYDFGHYMGEKLLSDRAHMLYPPENADDVLLFVGHDADATVDHFAEDGTLVKTYTVTKSASNEYCSVTNVGVTGFSQYDYFECSSPQAIYHHKPTVAAAKGKHQFTPLIGGYLAPARPPAITHFPDLKARGDALSTPAPASEHVLFTQRWCVAYDGDTATSLAVWDRAAESKRPAAYLQFEATKGRVSISQRELLLHDSEANAMHIFDLDALVDGVAQAALDAAPIRVVRAADAVYTHTSLLPPAVYDPAWSVAHRHQSWIDQTHAVIPTMVAGRRALQIFERAPEWKLAQVVTTERPVAIGSSAGGASLPPPIAIQMRNGAEVLDGLQDWKYYTNMKFYSGPDYTGELVPFTVLSTRQAVYVNFPKGSNTSYTDFQYEASLEDLPWYLTNNRVTWIGFTGSNRSPQPNYETELTIQFSAPVGSAKFFPARSGMSQDIRLVNTVSNEMIEVRNLYDGTYTSESWWSSAASSTMYMGPISGSYTNTPDSLQPNDDGGFFQRATDLSALFPAVAVSGAQQQSFRCAPSELAVKGGAVFHRISAHTADVYEKSLTAQRFVRTDTVSLEGLEGAGELFYSDQYVGVSSATALRLARRVPTEPYTYPLATNVAATPSGYSNPITKIGVTITTTSGYTANSTHPNILNGLILNTDGDSPTANPIAYTIEAGSFHTGSGMAFGGGSWTGSDEDKLLSTLSADDYSHVYWNDSAVGATLFTVVPSESTVSQINLFFLRSSYMFGVRLDIEHADGTTSTITNDALADTHLDDESGHPTVTETYNNGAFWSYPVAPAPQNADDAFVFVGTHADWRAARLNVAPVLFVGDVYEFELEANGTAELLLGSAVRVEVESGHTDTTQKGDWGVRVPFAEASSRYWRATAVDVDGAFVDLALESFDTVERNGTPTFEGKASLIAAGLDASRALALMPQEGQKLQIGLAAALDVSVSTCKWALTVASAARKGRWCVFAPQVDFASAAPNVALYGCEVFDGRSIAQIVDDPRSADDGRLTNLVKDGALPSTTLGRRVDLFGRSVALSDGTIALLPEDASRIGARRHQRAILPPPVLRASLTSMKLNSYDVEVELVVRAPVDASASWMVFVTDDLSLTDAQVRELAIDQYLSASLKKGSVEKGAVVSKRATFAHTLDATGKALLVGACVELKAHLVVLVGDDTTVASISAEREDAASSGTVTRATHAFDEEVPLGGQVLTRQFDLSSVGTVYEFESYSDSDSNTDYRVLAIGHGLGAMTASAMASDPSVVSMAFQERNDRDSYCIFQPLREWRAKRGGWTSSPDRAVDSTLTVALSVTADYKLRITKLNQNVAGNNRDGFIAVHFHEQANGWESKDDSVAFAIKGLDGSGQITTVDLDRSLDTTGAFGYQGYVSGHNGLTALLAEPSSDFSAMQLFWYDRMFDIRVDFEHKTTGDVLYSWTTSGLNALSNGTPTGTLYDASVRGGGPMVLDQTMVGATPIEFTQAVGSIVFAVNPPPAGERSLPIGAGALPRYWRAEVVTRDEDPEDVFNDLRLQVFSDPQRKMLELENYASTASVRAWRGPLGEGDKPQEVRLPTNHLDLAVLTGGGLGNHVVSGPRVVASADALTASADALTASSVLQIGARFADMSDPSAPKVVAQLGASGHSAALSTLVTALVPAEAATSERPYDLLMRAGRQQAITVPVGEPLDLRRVEWTEALKMTVHKEAGLDLYQVSPDQNPDTASATGSMAVVTAIDDQSVRAAGTNGWTAFHTTTTVTPEVGGTWDFELYCDDPTQISFDMAFGLFQDTDYFVNSSSLSPSGGEVNALWFFKFKANGVFMAYTQASNGVAEGFDLGIEGVAAFPRYHRLRFVEDASYAYTVVYELYSDEARTQLVHELPSTTTYLMTGSQMAPTSLAPLPVNLYIYNVTTPFVVFRRAPPLDFSYPTTLSHTELEPVDPSRAYRAFAMTLDENGDVVNVVEGAPPADNGRTPFVGSEVRKMALKQSITGEVTMSFDLHCSSSVINGCDYKVVASLRSLTVSEVESLVPIREGASGMHMTYVRDLVLDTVYDTNDALIPFERVDTAYVYVRTFDGKHAEVFATKLESTGASLFMHMPKAPLFADDTYADVRPKAHLFASQGALTQVVWGVFDRDAAIDSTDAASVHELLWANRNSAACGYSDELAASNVLAVDGGYTEAFVSLGGAASAPTTLRLKVVEKSTHGRIDMAELQLLDAAGNLVPYTASLAANVSSGKASYLYDNMPLSGSGAQVGVIWQDGTSYNVGDVLVTVTPDAAEAANVRSVRLVYYRPKYGPTLNIIDELGAVRGTVYKNADVSRDDEHYSTIASAIDANSYDSAVLDIGSSTETVTTLGAYDLMSAALDEQGQAVVARTRLPVASAPADWRHSPLDLRAVDESATSATGAAGISDDGSVVLLAGHDAAAGAGDVRAFVRSATGDYQPLWFDSVYTGTASGVKYANAAAMSGDGLRSFVLDERGSADGLDCFVRGGLKDAQFSRTKVFEWPTKYAGKNNYNRLKTDRRGASVLAYNVGGRHYALLKRDEGASALTALFVQHSDATDSANYLPGPISDGEMSADGRVALLWGFAAADNTLFVRMFVDGVLSFQHTSASGQQRVGMSSDGEFFAIADAVASEVRIFRRVGRDGSGAREYALFDTRSVASVGTSFGTAAVLFDATARVLLVGDTATHAFVFERRGALFVEVDYRKVMCMDADARLSRDATSMLVPSQAKVVEAYARRAAKDGPLYELQPRRALTVKEALYERGFGVQLDGEGAVLRLLIPTSSVSDGSFMDGLEHVADTKVSFADYTIDGQSVGESGVSMNGATYATSGVGAVQTDTNGFNYLDMGLSGKFVMPQYATAMSNISHTFYFVTRAADANGLISRMTGDATSGDYFNIHFGYGHVSMYPLEMAPDTSDLWTLTKTFNPKDSYIVTLVKLQYVSTNVFKMRMLVYAKPDGQDIEAEKTEGDVTAYVVSTHFTIGSKYPECSQHFKFYECGVIDEYVSDGDFDAIAESLKSKYYGGGAAAVAVGDTTSASFADYQNTAYVGVTSTSAVTSDTATVSPQTGYVLNIDMTAVGTSYTMDTSYSRGAGENDWVLNNFKVRDNGGSAASFVKFIGMFYTDHADYTIEPNSEGCSLVHASNFTISRVRFTVVKWNGDFSHHATGDLYYGFTTQFHTPTTTNGETGNDVRIEVWSSLNDEAPAAYTYMSWSHGNYGKSNSLTSIFPMPIWSEEPTLTLTNLMVGVEGYGGSMAAGLPTSSEVRYLSPPTHPLPQSAEDRFRTNRDRGHTLVTVIRPQVTDAASGALTHGANGKFQLYLRNDADFFGFDTVGSFGLSDDASASVFASEWALLIHSYQEGVGSEVRVRWLGNGKLVTRSASLTHTSPATASDTAFSLARDGASGITHGLYEFALHDRKMSASETDALLTKLTDSYFASSLASCAWRASREIDTLSVSYAVNATLTITKAVAWRAALFDFAQLDTEDPLAPSLLTMLTNNSQYATESASVGGGMESVSRHEVTLSRAFVSSGGAKEPLRKDRAYHLVLYGTDADGAVTVRDRKLLAHRAQTDPSALLASVDTAVVCTGLQANESVSVLPGTEVAADGVALPATLTDGLRALRLNGASDPVPIRESQNDPVTVVMVVRVNHDGYGAVTSSSAGDFDWRVTDAEIGLAGLGANVFSSGDAAAVDTTKAVYAVLLVSQQPSPTSTQVCYWLIDGNNAIAHASYQGAGSTTATALSIEPNHPLCELLISPVYMPKGSTEHQAIVTYVLNKYGGESIPTLQAPLVSLSNDVAKFDVSVFSTEADVSSWRAGVFQKDAVPTTAAEIYSVLGAASTIVGEALPSSAFVGGDASTIVNDDADGNGFTLSGGSGFMYAGVTLFESAALGQSYEWAVMMDNPTPDSNIRPIISFFSNSTGLVAVYLNIGIDANQNVEFGMALYSSIEDSTRVTVANQYNTYGENIDGFDYALDGRNLKIRDNADGDLLNASPSISDPLTKLNFKVTLVPHPSDPALLDIEFVCFRNDKKAEMIFNMPSIKHVHYGGYGTTEGDYKYVVQGEAWKMRQYAYQHDTMVSNFRDMTLISGDPSAPSPAVVSGDAVSRYTVENVSADLVKAVNADGSISSFGADGVAALAMLDARGEYTLRTRLVAFRSVPTEPPSDRWRLTWKDKIGTSAQRCGEIALYGDYFEPTQEHSPTTIASSSRAYLGDSRTVQDSSWNNTYAPWSADFTYAAPMTLHQVVIGSTDSGPNNSVGGFPSEYLNVEYLDDNGVWTLHSRLTFSEIVSGPGGTETESGSGLYPWNATTYPFTGHHGKDVFRWDGQKWYHHTAYGHAFDGTESGYLGNYPVTLNGVTYY
jgi:alpha-tubulin suppressor-like RCC1 family protein